MGMTTSDGSCSILSAIGDRSCAVMGARKSATCVTLSFLRGCTGFSCRICGSPTEIIVADGFKRHRATGIGSSSRMEVLKNMGDPILRRIGGKSGLAILRSMDS